MTRSSRSIPSIFISHSSKDSDFTNRLANNLRTVLKDGSAVWYDTSDLHAGAAWWRRIVEQITAREVFIVILSPDAMTSPWVNDEITLAWKQKNSSLGKYIIPVLYRRCEEREDIATLPHVLFLPPKPYEAGFEELLSVLHIQQEKLNKRHPTRRAALIGLFVIGLATIGSSVGIPSVHSWEARLISSINAHSLPSSVIHQQSGVSVLSWSPDGKHIASAGTPPEGAGTLTPNNTSVDIWSTATGKTNFTYHSNPSIDGLLWVPGGQRIISASSTLQAWDALTGAKEISYHPSLPQDIIRSVTAMIWLAAGPRIATARQYLASGVYKGDNVYVWDIITGGHAVVYQGHRNDSDLSIRAIAWSPSGTYIASAGEAKEVHVWDANTAKATFIYRGHTDVVSALAWSPDGKRVVSTSFDGTVQIWNAADGKNVLIYHGHADWVSSVAWSPDGGHIASGSRDKTVRVWNAANGSDIFVYQGHQSLVEIVAWSPNGEQIASSDNGPIHVWQPG